MKVGILGNGNVGGGARAVIARHPCGLEVKKVLARHIPAGLEGLVTTDPAEILEDPEIELVGEALNGLEPAYTYVSEALRRGKHVVSANKAMICRYFTELHALAAEHGAGLRFTPSAGGGIPWLVNLRRTLRCDRVTALRGILNGTTNYILDAMQTQGRCFEEVLAETQRMGYAEADPSADIDGLDAQRKCAISASIAFGIPVREEDVPVLGIRSVTAEDVQNFAAMGRICRLLVQVEEVAGAVSACVEPALLLPQEIECSIHACDNCISLTADEAGTLRFSGPGAGAAPTGSSLVQDMIDIAALGKAACAGNVVLDGKAVLGGDAIHSIRHPYYVRSQGKVPPELVRGGAGSAKITAPLTPQEAVQLERKLHRRDKTTFLAAILPSGKGNI